MTRSPRSDPSPTTRRGARSFRTPVRGYPFASRPPSASAPQPGQVAALVREPDNPADPLAIAVWVEEDGTPWRIGYLDRGVSARLSRFLDAGWHINAVLDGWVGEPDGRWQRPLLLLRAVASHAGADPDSDTPSPEQSTDDARARAARSGHGVDAGASIWGRPPGVTRRRVTPPNRRRTDPR